MIQKNIIIEKYMAKSEDIHEESFINNYQDIYIENFDLLINNRK
jgi:hypothetical protein